MQDEIEKILSVYPSARASSPFKGPHEVQKTFQRLKAQVEQLPSVAGNPNLLVKYSYGKGNWATVPWLAILDSRETTSTQDGTYIVLLFREDGVGCHLKLAQGVTTLKKSFGRRAADELSRRASQVRESFPEMEDTDFDLSGDPKLGAEKGIAKLYEASTIFSKYWDAASVPTDAVITESIDKLINVYSRYIDDRLENEETEDLPVVGDDRRIWAISPGEGGRLWDDFRQQGVIAIGWDQLGNLDQYVDQAAITERLGEIFDDDRKRSNSSLACHQFSKEIQVGDIVIAKAGRKKVLGMGVVTSEYAYRESAKEYKNQRDVDWLRSDATEFPGSGIAIKTLTELTEYRSIIELVESYLNIDFAHDEATAEEIEEDDKQTTYTISDIVSEGCFVGADMLRARLDRLRLKKNIILQGPPGTGKTWLAKRLAYALIGKKDRARIRVVQFHPNLSYEDFVRGWRPSGDGTLSLVDGPFMEAIDDAKNSSRPHVVVIEEVNRGNPAQIFGEMLTLLEADKRIASEGIELSYRKHSDERVFIPPNLFVIGTMNLADRSLALVDMALRRRFAFIDMVPTFNAAWREYLSDEIGFDQKFIDRIEQRVNELNETIAGDASLGPQYCIGHSYLTPPADAQISDFEVWFQQVADTEIGPLIAEYWFDDPSRVDEALSRFRS